MLCFGSRKKGRRRNYIAETDALLRELKLELTELRVGHQRLNEQSLRMTEELAAIRIQRDGLVQERHNLVLSAGSMKEQLFEIQMENQRLQQKLHKLEKENNQMKGVDCGEGSGSDESMAQRDFRDMEMRFSSSKAKVDMLRVEISKLEMEKSMVEHQSELKQAALNQKMASLKRACMDKDSMLNNMRGEKSKILMCLWKATYGNTSNNTDAPAQLFYSHTKDLPLATVEPYNRGANSLACVSHCLKFEHPVPFQHPDVLRNKTMTLEFELYRERKMAELIASDFSLFSDYTSMEDVRPGSESTHDKRDVFGTISTHTISSCYSSVTVESS